MSWNARRFLDALGPLGFVIIVGSRWAVRAGKTLPGGSEIYLAVGAALLLAHLVVRWETLFGKLGRRQMKYGANTVALVLVVLGILGTVNYLVVRNTKRWDLTSNQRFSLAPQTKKILEGLQDTVKMTYFKRDTDTSVSAQDRLKEYQAASSRIRVEYLDPWKSPAKAREYDITTVPSLVIEYRGKRERITSDSEQDITNALIKVTREGQKTVCFVEGEGERDPDEYGDTGYSSAKAALERSQYATRKVFLVRERTVPGDCTVAVVAAPEKDLLDPAIDALRSFVVGGGKLLVLIEPKLGTPQPKLEALLREWKLELKDDIVVDVSGMGQLFRMGPITPLAVDYPYHEITKDLRRVMTAFHTARSVEAGSETVKSVTSQNLVRTSEASWAESDLALKEPIQLDQGKDRAGPISLGAVATVEVARAEPSPSPSPSAQGEADKGEAEEDAGDKEPESPKPEGRVVAVGDADFASNALLSFQANQDLFLNMTAWLSQDTDLISIRPKEPEDQRLVLTQQQQGNVQWTALVYLPGFFIVLGLANWWRRRG